MQSLSEMKEQYGCFDITTSFDLQEQGDDCFLEKAVLQIEKSDIIVFSKNYMEESSLRVLRIICAAMKKKHVFV